MENKKTISEALFLNGDFPMDIISSIKGILEQDTDNGEVDISNMFQNVYFSVPGYETDLMIRFVKVGRKITIARVLFNKKGQGTVGKLLNVLEEFILSSDDYDKLAFESVLNESFAKYLVRVGFEELPYAPMNFEKKLK